LKRDVAPDLLVTTEAIASCKRGNGQVNTAIGMISISLVTAILFLSFGLIRAIRSAEFQTVGLFLPGQTQFSNGPIRPR